MLLLVESSRNQIVIPVGLVWTFGNEISITLTIVTSKFAFGIGFLQVIVPFCLT